MVDWVLLLEASNNIFVVHVFFSIFGLALLLHFPVGLLACLFPTRRSRGSGGTLEYFYLLIFLD
jgi:hypothetical protein